MEVLWRMVPFARGWFMEDDLVGDSVDVLRAGSPLCPVCLDFRLLFSSFCRLSPCSVEVLTSVCLSACVSADAAICPDYE